MADGLSDELVAKLRERIENNMIGLRITDFQALPDHDHDGDPILWLQIVYDETVGEPLAAHTSTLARHLRPLLIDADLPDTFPILRFLSASDFADEAR